MTMDERVADQGWQQLQAHITGFLGQALKTDAQRVRYEPRFISPPSEKPAERRGVTRGDP